MLVMKDNSNKLELNWEVVPEVEGGLVTIIQTDHVYTAKFVATVDSQE